MRITQLYSENIKRLHAVSISPAGDVVEITGSNGQGKSSLLDSIFYALAGTSGVPSEPIRRGADTATIKLDLGALKVTRKFRRQEGGKFTTSLTVENAEGAVYKSPQAMLESLLSGLTFDPLAFARMKPREQFDALRRFVPDVDFEAIERANQADRDQRTDANRKHREASAAAAAVIIPKSPDDTIDEASIMDQIENAGRKRTEIERESDRRQDASRRIGQQRQRAGNLRTNAAQMRAEAEELERQAAELETTSDREFAELDALPVLGALPDTAALRQELRAAQTVNQAIAQAAQSRRHKTSLQKVADDAEKLSEELTASIEARDAAKTRAIASAAMPVEALGFGDGCVTFKGIPFDQASSAEQLRVSCAIAMRANEKLKIVLIRDGSLLDKDSMRLIAQLAEEHGAQVWVESVFAHSDAAIVIEDGSVRAMAAVESPEAASA